ncbi:hypothetical protein LguiB_000350 [Lonicera macranthoides]
MVDALLSSISAGNHPIGGQMFPFRWTMDLHFFQKLQALRSSLTISKGRGNVDLAGEEKLGILLPNPKLGVPLKNSTEQACVTHVMSSSEKIALPNLSVRGYEVINAAKASLKAVCPGVVSCADIIIMATRDVILLSGGGLYSVETGRKDGLVSLNTNVNLPSSSISVSDSVNAFANKSLTPTDMVYLLGVHGLGPIWSLKIDQKHIAAHGT